MRYRVLPYRQGSRSAKALAEALGGKVLRLEGSTFVPKSDDVIINWGNTVFNEDAEWGSKTPDQFFNYDTDCLRLTTNKLEFFQHQKEVGNAELLPSFWTDKASIPDDAFPVVCRTILNGHSGAGIVIADTRDGVADCELYVKYLKKKEEYRVHVGRRSEDIVVIAVQRKARRTNHPNPNWQIRNLANGFVYVRNECNPAPSVISSAIETFRATGLDFGAVDVIWNSVEEKAYALEINSAPGLVGTTVEDYANFFKTYHL